MFYVVSAAPQEVDPVGARRHRARDHIYRHATFDYRSNRRDRIDRARVPGGLRQGGGAGGTASRDCRVSHDRIVYVGDGSSDVHVMLHVNRLDGLTIAVSENKYITQIAQRTMLSDDALSVLVPVLEDIVGWNSDAIRAFFEAHGFFLREWDKVRTDSLTICRTGGADGCIHSAGSSHDARRAGMGGDGGIFDFLFLQQPRRCAAFRPPRRACGWHMDWRSAMPVVAANLIVAAAALYSTFQTRRAQ